MTDTTKPKDYYYTPANYETYRGWFEMALAGVRTTVLAGDTGFKPSTLRVMARSALDYGRKELSKPELEGVSIHTAKDGETKKVIGILIAPKTRRTVKGHEVIPQWKAELKGWLSHAKEGEAYEEDMTLTEVDQVWLRTYCHEHEAYCAVGEGGRGFKVVR
jgi:hypothetical protein